MVVPFWTPITPLTGSLLHADPHTAEGIETVDDLSMAIRAGIDCVQGYFFCHAVAADSLAAAIVSAEKVICNIVTPTGGFDQRDASPGYGSLHRRQHISQLR
jgi:hypothetical protein